MRFDLSRIGSGEIVGGASKLATARKPLTMLGGTDGSESISPIKPCASTKMAPSTDANDVLGCVEEITRKENKPTCHN